MWNYNIDEMPKDGSKIIGFFKDKKYESTSVFYYDADDWRRVSHCLPVSTRYLQCWALAPEEPEEDLKGLIDWFDQLYPCIAKYYGVPYWKGLIAIRDRINFKLSQYDRKEPEVAVSDERVTEKVCPICARHKDGYGAVCLTCGRGLGG